MRRPWGMMISMDSNKYDSDGHYSASARRRVELRRTWLRARLPLASSRPRIIPSDRLFGSRSAVQLINRRRHENRAVHRLLLGIAKAPHCKRCKVPRVRVLRVAAANRQQQ